MSGNNPKKTFDAKPGYQCIGLYVEITSFSDQYTTTSTHFVINKNINTREISIKCVGSIRVDAIGYALFQKNSVSN